MDGISPDAKVGRKEDMVLYYSVIIDGRSLAEGGQDGE